MQTSALPQLSVQQLAPFVRDNAALRPVLLDVREPWELATARLTLDGAQVLNIPMNQLPARLSEIDPAQPVLVLCHHGARSQHCVAFLVQQGHPQAYNVAGGIDAWSREVDASVPRY